MRIDKFISGFIGGTILTGAILLVIFMIGTAMVFVKDDPISLVFIIPAIIGGIIAGVMNVRAWRDTYGE